MLLLKLTLVATRAALGAFNWRRARPKLGVATGTMLLRRSATLELSMGLLVLLVTAVLVALPPP